MEEGIWGRGIRLLIAIRLMESVLGEEGVSALQKRQTTASRSSRSRRKRRDVIL